MRKHPIWHETFRVRSYEVGPDGRLFLRHLCNYLQEAAANHASVLGFSIRDLEKEQFTWVLLRLQVHISHYPTWQDVLHVETWPAGVERRFAYRDFIVFREDGTEIARASSTWLMIQLATRRPVPVPEEIIRLHIPDRPRVLDTPFPRLRLPEQSPDNEQTFPVMFSDIDLNRHVNNTRYLDWALELEPAFRYPSKLYAEFRAEASEKQVIRSRSYPLEEKQRALFALHHADQERLLALVLAQK